MGVGEAAARWRAAERAPGDFSLGVHLAGVHLSGGQRPPLAPVWHWLSMALVDGVNRDEQATVAQSLSDVAPGAL